MAKRIQLFEPLECPFTINADRFRLKQILFNLLSNGIKFTPEGGTLHIDCNREEDFVRIAVSDTGIGPPRRSAGDL